MQFRPIFNIGVITVASFAIAYPTTAQPIPSFASSACIQRTAEEMVVATRDIQITGAGPVNAENGVRTLFMRNTVTGQTAECRVNTIDGFVLGVTLTSQPNRPPQTVPQASINACIQRTAEEMVVQARNIEMQSAGPANSLGERTLFMRDRTTGQTAECRVNTMNNTVLSVRLTSQPNRPPSPPPSQGRPLSPNAPIARDCQAAVGNQVRRSFSGVQKLNFLSDTTRAYFISNAQEGVRGEGQFYQRSGSWHRFNYNCTVNIRSGRVEQSTFNLIR